MPSSPSLAFINQLETTSLVGLGVGTGAVLSTIGKELIVAQFKPTSLSGVLVVSAVLSACSMPTWTSPPGTESFQIGYRDGCDAGYAVAGSVEGSLAVILGIEATQIANAAMIGFKPPSTRFSVLDRSR